MFCHTEVFAGSIDPRNSKATYEMSPYLAELIGMMILVLLGDGVCANVSLNKTFGQNTGWLVITTGWAMAVTVAVYMTSVHSGAHLNPAVTIGLAAIGEFETSQVGGYLMAQLTGAILGATLVWLTYLPHWKETNDPDAIRSCFCNTPAIANVPANLLTEIIGTFVLVLGIVTILRPDNMIPGTGFKEGFQRRISTLCCWHHGLGCGIVTWWSDGICHQSCSRPRTSNCSRHPSDRKQRIFWLELFMDPRRWPTDRRNHRDVCVSSLLAICWLMPREVLPIVETLSQTAEQKYSKYGHC